MQTNTGGSQTDKGNPRERVSPGRSETSGNTVANRATVLSRNRVWLFLQSVETMAAFDAAAEAARLKRQTQLYRPKRYARSKLDKWRPEILALRAEGATLEQIQIWLREHRIRAELSTISRWLKRNPPHASL